MVLSKNYRLGTTDTGDVIITHKVPKRAHCLTVGAAATLNGNGCDCEDSVGLARGSTAAQQHSSTTAQQQPP